MLDKNGVDHESEFWSGFVKSDRFLLDWCSDKKTNEFNETAYQFIGGLNSQRILDVGSGPVSLLHGSYSVHIDTTDPLTEFYQKIVDFKKLKIKPPFPFSAENIPDWENRYDLVHCSNALDHCYDPALAIREMWKCVKPGGYLVIQLHENEANHEDWAGFHRWNAHFSQNLFMLGGKSDVVVVDYELPGNTRRLFYTEMLVTGRTWLIVAYQKVNKL